MAVKTENCPSRRCGYLGKMNYEWEEFKDGTRHIRMSCPMCGRFLRWARQDRGAVRAADKARRQAEVARRRLLA